MIFKYFLSFLLLFLYLTQVRSVFFTFPIFYFLSIMGLFVLLLQIVKNRVDRNLFFIILINLSMIVLQMFSFIINEGGDFKFLREVVLYNFLSMLFCLFFYNLSVNSKFDFNYIYLISSAVLLQLILSLFAYLNPSFFDLLFYYWNVRSSAGCWCYLYCSSRCRHHWRDNWRGHHQLRNYSVGTDFKWCPTDTNG